MAQKHPTSPCPLCLEWFGIKRQLTTRPLLRRRHMALHDEAVKRGDRNWARLTKPERKHIRERERGRKR